MKRTPYHTDYVLRCARKAPVAAKIEGVNVRLTFELGELRYFALMRGPRCLDIFTLGRDGKYKRTANGTLSGAVRERAIRYMKDEYNGNA